MKTAAFDRVLVPQANGQTASYTQQEFMELPVDDRVRMILARTATFYRGEIVIDQTEALKGIRGTR
jgi:hypothetical protein